MHRFSLRAVIIVFVVPVYLAGCDLLGPKEKQAAVRALTGAEEHVVAADHRFGMNLFRALSEEDEQENVFISPLSVSMALGMTMNGADGETYDAMQTTLELNGLSEEDINESYQTLIELLHGLDPEVVFEIANSIWYRQGFQVEPEFIDVNQIHFGADIRELDFGDPGAVDVINGWVDEKTHGKIEEILEEIDPGVVMYLINAIYFNGTWTYEFDPDETQQRPFTHIDGTQSDVPMMAQQADLPYFETDEFEAVDLPYGDSLYSMAVILPREGEDIDALIARLDSETWSDWMGRFRTTDVTLKLPRFKIEYEKELNDVLSALGMEIAFDPGRADLSRIREGGGLWIDYVKHKSFVEVDEEGTEAAAVTVVAIRECAGCGGTSVSMTVNRPFIFSIRERNTGTILFMGKVVSL